jgi:hypothetical protein
MNSCPPKLTLNGKAGGLSFLSHLLNLIEPCLRYKVLPMRPVRTKEKWCRHEESNFTLNYLIFIYNLYLFSELYPHRYPLIHSVKAVFGPKWVCSKLPFTAPWWTKSGTRSLFGLGIALLGRFPWLKILNMDSFFQIAAVPDSDQIGSFRH